MASEPIPAEIPSPLVLPELDDTSSTLLAKLERIEDYLAQGHRLGAATHDTSSPAVHEDATQVAKSRMSPLESESWDAFLRGNIRLPRIDWDINCGETPTSKNGLKKAQRRAEALNRLYGSDRAQPSHSVWFTAHHLEYLSLIKAMARVIGAERQLRQATRGHVSDLVDSQTIRNIISTSLKVHQRHSSTSKAISSGINKKIQLLVCHQRKIQYRRHAHNNTKEDQDPILFRNRDSFK